MTEESATELIQDIINHSSITHIYIVEGYNNPYARISDETFKSCIKEIITKDNVHNYKNDSKDGIYLYDDISKYEYMMTVGRRSSSLLIRCIFIICEYEGWITQYFYDKYNPMEREYEYKRCPWLKKIKDEVDYEIDLLSDFIKIREPIVKYAGKS